MIRRALALLALALLSACATPQFDPPRIAEIDRIVERYQARSTAPGFAVGVIDGKKISVLGYGRISKGGQEEPRGDTIYEIGSITKVFTSFVLADLAQDGVVKLNDPIQVHLPSTVTAPRSSDQEILLTHLATHQSGLPRLPPNLPAFSDDPYANYGVDRLYDFLNAHRLRRSVGKSYEYSNLGMGLLGTLLERAAGMSYEQLVVRRIADPLKMRDTRITLTGAMEARLAPPYDHKGKPSHTWQFQALAGAGALRSTVDDLLKFAAANLGQGNPRMTGVLASCHAVRHEVVSDRLRIGLAWHLSPLRTGSPQWVTWHNGATGGYASFLGFVKETGTAVVVLSNGSLAPTHDAKSECDQIGFEILELLNP
jgi:D-alanyl-D-alanine-carboxypeptidase/D-alanyl-D-alanine-endopeptidase